MKTYRGIFRLTGLAILLASTLAAQVLNGRIEVLVTDPSGQVVAGAKAALKDLRKQTPAGAPISTDTTGTALFASVAPGEYELTVEAPGFRKAIVSGFELNASQTIKQSVMLEIGSVTEAIQVEANAVAVNTSDATIARTINMKAIDTLPQLARNPMALVSLVPGASLDPGDSSFTRVNGARQGSNNTRLDGIDANDAVVPRLGLAMSPVNTDSLEEVRVITNGGKAEYGRNAGGQVELVTRSGSNAWHGNAFDYLRNTVLNAGTYFNNASGVPRPVFIQNIFGGSMGGRILRNKLFFFGNYQGRRTTQSTVRNRTVLTPEAKQGIFRYVSGGQTLSYNIPQNDPAGRGIDPTMRTLMALMPNPNNTDVGDGLNTQGFRFNIPTPAKDDQGTGKVDWLQSPTHRVFFRYSRQFMSSIDALNSAEQRYPGLPDGSQGGPRWSYSVGSDWTITNWLINEFRIGRSSASVDFVRPYREGGIAVISNLYDDPINNGLPQGRNSPVVDITDNVSMLRGKHTFKAGMNFRRVLQYGYNAAGIYPNANLSRTSAGNTPPATVGPAGVSSADRQRFEGLFNDVLGRVGQVSQTFYSDLEKYQEAGTPRVRNTVFRDLGLFFQDDWKVTSNLTLNIGLRWEMFGAPSEQDRLQGVLNRINDVNVTSQIDNFVMSRTDKWFDTDYNNFAPRFGFAWDPFKTGKTSIRGSWGVFYDRMIGATSNLVDGNTPGFAQAVITFPSQNAPAFASSLSGALLPSRPGTIITNQPQTRQTSVVQFRPDLATGYVQQMNLGIQHQITRNTVVDATFVRSMGTKLFGWQDLNQPRIQGDFLNAFKELQAFQASGTAVSPGNTLSRIFGTPAAAITALGATVIRDGLAGSAAQTLDQSNFTRYAGAGVSNFYLRNFPQYNQFLYGDSTGSSSYNSLQLQVTHRTKNLVLNANYTYARSIDNMSVDGNGFTAPVDNFNLVNNRGRADFDRPHVVTYFGSYSLPFGKGKRFLSDTNGFVNRVIGGWEIGALGAVQSGTVFSLTSGRRTAGSTLNQYINYTGDRTIGEVDKRGNGVYFFTPEQVTALTVPSAFPGAGEIGNSGRNSFRGPGFFNLDASIVKQIPITERLRSQFRVEMYNALNRANFALPGVSIVTPATLGRISGLSNGSSGTGARVMQMALRLDF